MGVVTVRIEGIDALSAERYADNRVECRESIRLMVGEDYEHGAVIDASLRETTHDGEAVWFVEYEYEPDATVPDCDEHALKREIFTRSDTLLNGMLRTPAPGP